MPFQLLQAIRQNICFTQPGPYHRVHLVPHVAVWFSVASDRVFLNSITRTACFGREKEASDLAPEASADLSDFLASPQPTPNGEEEWAISVPFARENLHLVISSETQPLYLLYSVVNPAYNGGDCKRRQRVRQVPNW